MTDKIPDTCQCHEKQAPAYWKGVAREYREELEIVERQRDKARNAACADKDAHWRLDEAMETIQGLIKDRDEALRALGEALDSHDETLRDVAEGKYATNPRPLAPDAITDEMVNRAFDAADHHAAVVINKAIIREALTAALAEPPKRPEGAAEIESAIRAWDENGDTNADHGDWDNLADFLASHGVRVVTEEAPR